MQCVHLVCVMYIGFKSFAPEQDIGFDLSEEYAAAKAGGPQSFSDRASDQISLDQVERTAIYGNLISLGGG